MSDPNLVTSYNLHGHDYMVKMNVVNGFLELLITDKQSGEEWQCSYDNAYVENLTHKTGNYKQFDIFVTMLKSGLLKTSTSISLDLLTYEDLESMRIRRFKSSSSTRNIGAVNTNNRRYLIVTYTVEFDRIHYPLPLEYCGPPDPAVLQSTIKKLRAELAEVKDQTTPRVDSKKLFELQKRVDELYAENVDLRGKLTHMRQVSSGCKHPQSNLKTLQMAIYNLEKSVASERKSHHQLVERLKRENETLMKQMEELRGSEKILRLKLQRAITENIHLKQGKAKPQSNDSVKTMFRRQQSPVFDLKARSASPQARRPNKPWEKMMTRTADDSLLGRATPPKSRSSSVESSKPLEASDSPTSEVETTDRRPQTTPSKTRKKLTKSRNKSGSSRQSSGGSSTSVKTKRSDSLHFMLRTSESEFKNLEERIEDLHSLLKTNFK